MPRLYNYDLDETCYRVRLTASVLGVPLDIVNIDAFPGREQDGPECLALNPLGRLPILTEGALVLSRAAAIQQWLAELAPSSGFVPDDAAGRARMQDWLGFADAELAACVQAREVALMDAPGDLAALVARARMLLRIMDDHMTAQRIADHDWVAGPSPSLADLALFPAFALCRDYNLDHDEFPELRLWARRLRRLPGFITMPGIPDYH